MERRNTIQKDLVLQAVRTMRTHVSADEVYEHIRKTHPRIGKGTVYRNLAILVDEHLVGRIEIPNGPDRFDFVTKRHYHCRCIECGIVSDIELDEITDIKDHVLDSHGMMVLDDDILFRGLCADCQKSIIHPLQIKVKM